LRDGGAPRQKLEARPNVAATNSHVRDLALATFDGFTSGSEDEIPGVTDPSPYDSQYEMTAVLGGDPDDSQTELPAFMGGPDESGEIVVGPLPDTPSSEFVLPVPWYFNFIDSWGRLHFYVASGFAAASLAVLIYLLVRALVAGETLSSSATVLIIGCVGIIAFLLISLSATALTVLLVDLVRNVRMLIQQADRNSVGHITPTNQDRTRFSQPVA
jgi:hypothetical protein